MGQVVGQAVGMEAEGKAEKGRKGPLIAAIGCGLVAVVLLQLYLQQEKRQQHAGMEMVDVVVAAHDLTEGTRLEQDLLTSKALPSLYVHDKVVRFLDLQKVLGQPLSYPVKAGEPILWATVGREGGGGLSTMIIKGERALTLPVDEVSGLSGLIQPHDHVDVYGTFPVRAGQSSRTGEATIPLLQNVLVLAVGERVGEATSVTEETGLLSSTVTVSVTPEQASLLVYAQSQGKLVLLLRNTSDLDVSADPVPLTFDQARFHTYVEKMAGEQRRRR